MNTHTGWSLVHKEKTNWKVTFQTPSEIFPLKEKLILTGDGAWLVKSSESPYWPTSVATHIQILSRFLVDRQLSFTGEDDVTTTRPPVGDGWIPYFLSMLFLKELSRVL